MSSLNPDAPAFVPQSARYNNLYSLWDQQEQLLARNAYTVSRRQEMAAAAAESAIGGEASGGMSAGGMLGPWLGLAGSLASTIQRGVTASQDRATYSELTRKDQEIAKFNAETSRFSADTARNYFNLERSNNERLWNAVNSMGLYSISQIGDASSSSIYYSTGQSSMLNRGLRAKRNSPYSLANY